MSPAVSRWLIAGLLVIAVPWPMPGPFDAFVPPLRYLMLALAAGAVGASEGMAGPLPAIIALLWAQAAGTILLSLALGWVGAKLLGRLSARMRRTCVLGAAVAWVLYALFVDVFRTPFGDTRTATLWSVLFA